MLMCIVLAIDCHSEFLLTFGGRLMMLIVSVNYYKVGLKSLRYWESRDCY